MLTLSQTTIQQKWFLVLCKHWRSASKISKLGHLECQCQKASSSCLHLNQWCTCFIHLSMWDFAAYLDGCYFKQPSCNLMVLFGIYSFNKEESIPVKGLPSTSLILNDVHWHIHINLIAHSVYFITPMVL